MSKDSHSMWEIFPSSSNFSSSHEHISHIYLYFSSFNMYEHTLWAALCSMLEIPREKSTVVLEDTQRWQGHCSHSTAECSWLRWQTREKVGRRSSLRRAEAWSLEGGIGFNWHCCLDCKEGPWDRSGSWNASPAMPMSLGYFKGF